MPDPQPLDDEDVFAVARRLGLGRAVELMPEDVREAFANAQRTIAQLPKGLTNDIDPWSPEATP